MTHDDRNKKRGAHRSRALVLGAGGPAGRAWQSGLIAGLIEREIDLGDALIVGTSAGAIVGAQLALGLKFAAPSKLDLAVQAAPASSSSDLSGLLAAMARAVRSSEPEIERAKIGAFALEARTASEEDSIARTAFAQIRGHSWPMRFCATAVNAHTGKLQVWDASSGATLERAVASSAAIPGVWPPITIKGERYIDGGVRSMLNADLATGCDIVVVVSCFALEGVGAIEHPDMAAINAALIAELGALRNAASTLTVIAPNEAFLTLTHRGAGMLDGNLEPEAFRIGCAQALQEAEEIRLAWNS
jgi:NTE family protein